ncbi:MAG: hypothetical protein J7L43_00155 [Candidatus Aenigmarchaeota archaeon]|nr:hypothetical protein [Candidatus Aenigmarchaeota archaeon]
MKNNLIIRYGVEIETATNLLLDSDEKAPYHEWDEDEYYLFAGQWKVEEDGSLGEHGYIDTAEFILRYPKEKRAFFRALRGWKEGIQRRGFKRLHSAVEFNKTCGCHIHISLSFKNGKMLPVDFVKWEHLVAIRKRVLKKIDRELPHIYPFFVGQYYRNYAQRMESIENGFEERYSEWNLQTADDEDFHIEWRSFNLMGVKTWADFFKMFRIAIDTIETVFRGEMQKEHPFLVREERKITPPNPILMENHNVNIDIPTTEQLIEVEIPI